MDYAVYWKEIAVVLAGLFAITGAIFDIRDRQTRRITSWGRVFLLLTILSMIGGFYSQWKQSAAEATKSEKATADMAQLLGQTRQSIVEIERLLHPFGLRSITVGFTPNCSSVAFRKFCAERKLEGARLSKKESDESTFFLDYDSLPDWPRERSSGPFNSSPAKEFKIVVFKDFHIVENAVKMQCFDCLFDGNLSYSVDFVPELPFGIDKSQSVYFSPYYDTLNIALFDRNPVPNNNDGTFVSLQDLGGATILVLNYANFINDISLEGIVFKMITGEERWFSNFNKIVIEHDGGRTSAFICRIGNNTILKHSIDCSN